MAQHNFNEKKEEYSVKDGKKIPVVLTSKYLETKAKVIEMLDSGIYKGLNDSYFWILMNRTNKGEMAYTGLIISHDGMKVINDNLSDDLKVKPMAFSPPITSEIKKECMYMYYQDDDTYELGEISTENCKNAYPYAMLYKRCYDRVVKSKAKMYGVYSEAEADEFKENIEDYVQEETTVYDELKKLYKKETIREICSRYGLDNIEELDEEIAQNYIKFAKEKKNENNK